MSDTPQTDERTYPADCLGKTPVVNADWAKLLERENAALKVQIRELIATMEEEGEMDAVRIAELKKDNAALREDKERLDWLQNGGNAVDDVLFDMNVRIDFDVRAAIDAAREEKP
jgi:hypothetical protein